MREDGQNDWDMWNIVTKVIKLVVDGSMYVNFNDMPQQVEFHKNCNSSTFACMSVIISLQFKSRCNNDFVSWYLYIVGSIVHYININNFQLATTVSFIHKVDRAISCIKIWNSSALLKIVWYWWHCKWAKICGHIIK